MTGKKFELQTAVERDEAFPIRVTSRAYMSTQHLYAAWYAAEAAKEQELYLVENLRSLSMRHRGAVLSAIVESVAFLEAAINELFQDAAHDRDSYIGSLRPESRSAMAAAWRATSEGRIRALSKYNLALELCGKAPFRQDEEPYRAAALLIRLRNYVVHYKPDDISADEEDKLGKALRNRFAGNRAAADGQRWFPGTAFSAGCAEWSWRSARAFVNNFADRLGLTLNYHQAVWEESLPQ